MKKVLLLIIIFLISKFVYAQFPPAPQILDKKLCVDTAYIELLYSFKFKNLAGQKDFTEDIRKIQIGNHIVKDFSQIVFHYDSLATERTKKGLQTQNIPTQTYPCELYSDVENHLRKEKYRLMLNAGVLCYDSQWITPEWQFIPDDTIRLSNYLCNKAQINYAGRNYTAWYALDYPISYGPFKFWGLPGLIIKIEEESGLFIWELYKMNKVHSPIYKCKYDKEQNCTERSAKRTIDKMMSSPMSFLQSVGTKMMVRRSDGSFGAPSQNNQQEVYQPIELK